MQLSAVSCHVLPEVEHAVRLLISPPDHLFCILVETPDNLADGYNCCPQPFRTNPGIVLEIRTGPSPSVVTALISSLPLTTFGTSPCIRFEGIRLHLYTSVYVWSLGLQILIIQTGRCGRVCGVPASYPRGAGFKSRPGCQYPDWGFRGFP